MYTMGPYLYMYTIKWISYIASVDPSVIILDHPDSLVFPVGIKIATVNISIFSSLDVSTVKVVKEDGTALTGISLVKAQFVAGYNHYYQVVFYQPSSTFNGTYRVEATIDGSVTNPHATTFSVRMSDCELFKIFLWGTYWICNFILV